MPAACSPRARCRINTPRWSAAARCRTIELCNAGHPAPLIVRGGDVQPFEASNLPIGMFASAEFAVSELRLEPGESMVIFSDGVSEAMDVSGAEYGVGRLSDLVKQRAIPSAQWAACRDDLTSFRRNAPRTDDVTLFVLGRSRV